MCASRKKTTPFVGPYPIQKGELLFGRDNEVGDLLDLLFAEHIVLLHSPSGAGKSSLVNAGLIPILEKKHLHILPVIRVNKKKKKRSTGFLGRIKLSPANPYILSTMLSLESALPSYVHSDSSLPAETNLDQYLLLIEKEIDSRRNVVLILDQFEEILTLNPIDLDVKYEFFRQLGEALRNRRRWALFVAREDYVGSLDPYLQYIPTQLSVRFRLELLTRDAAKQAIQRPRPTDMDEGSHLLTDNFTPEAADKLAEDLVQIRVQQPDGKSLLQSGLYIEPVQLQVVCERLWRQAQARGETRVGIDALKEVGTVDEALAGYFAEKVEIIARRLKVPEWRIRHWFDHQLITAQGIRSQVMRDVNQSAGLENKVIAELMKAYLVRAEQRRGVTWYELAHDRLVDPIRNANLQWYKDHLSPFHDRAVRWEAQDRPSDLLLNESDLSVMEQWVRKYPGRMSSAEQTFWAASRKERNQRLDVAARRTNLADLGWGVIFAAKEDEDWVRKLVDALDELLTLRRDQAGDRYREFTKGRGYRPGEDSAGFLRHNGVFSNTLEPDKVPYYLLIVGDPETISWEFQYSLAAQYAVGRIHFGQLEEYSQYARSVVAAEQGKVTLCPQVDFFSPQYPGDEFSRLTCEYLVAGLAKSMSEAWPTWHVEALFASDATKEQLTRLLGGDQTPALLFTASHGMEFDKDDPLQLSRQGALVCQDWPGPDEKTVKPEYYFTASDVDAKARLLGSVAFFWGGYSAGTPKMDDFYRQAFMDQPEQIARYAFIARLPQRLLAHPKGGMLAIIGHVERVWSLSFLGPEQRVGLGIASRSIYLTHFKEALWRLLDGHTVGSAMESFRNRYTVLASRLVEGFLQNKELDDFELAEIATAVVDARNYVILGDPAVRLPVSVEAKVAIRPTIEPVVPAMESVLESNKPEPFAELSSVAPLSKGITEPPLHMTEFVVANGIDAVSGRYVLSPLSLEEMAKIVIEELADQQLRISF